MAKQNEFSAIVEALTVFRDSNTESHSEMKELLKESMRSVRNQIESDNLSTNNRLRELTEVIKSHNGRLNK